MLRTTLVLLLLCSVLLVQSENLQELRNKIKASSSVEEYDFKVEKFDVSEIIGNAFEVTGYVEPGHHKTVIKYTDAVDNIKRDVKSLVSGELIGHFLPALQNHFLSKTKILKGYVMVSKQNGVEVNLEIDFTTLPRNIQKFIPLQKSEIKGRISKIPSRKELSNIDAAFEIISLLKEFTFLKKFDFKKPSIHLKIERNPDGTKVPLAKFESDLIVKLSDPIDFKVEGIFRDEKLIILKGRTTKNWEEPFGIPKLTINDLAAHLEIPFESKAYFSIQGNLIIFKKEVEIEAEFGDEIAFLTGKLQPIPLSEFSGVYSKEFAELVKKLPIEIEIKSSTITIANATGIGRNQRHILNGVTLESTGKITIPSILSADNIACLANVNKKIFTASCKVPELFKLGPLKVKDTVASVSVTKEKQIITLLSTADLFDKPGLKFNTTVFRPEGGRIQYFFHAKPKGLSLRDIKDMINTPFDDIRFGNADLYFSTSNRPYGNERIPKGLSIQSHVDLQKSGKFFERIYNVTGVKQIGIFANLGPVLEGKIDPKQMSFGGYGEIHFRKLKFVKQSSFTLFFGIAPSTVHFKGSVLIVLPRSGDELKFTGEFSMKASGMIEAHATLQSSWHPFGLKSIKVNHAALALGIHPAVIATTGTPSMIGAAGSFTWPTLGNLDFGLLVDTIDAGQSLFHAKFKKISTDNILGLINFNIPNVIPDIALIDGIIHIAPAGGRIGEIKFERGFYVKGELQVVGKSLLKAAIKIDDSGFQGKAQLADITFGKFLRIEGVEFDIELSTNLQRLYFNGNFHLFGVTKKINVDFKRNAIYFETSLKSKYFSYLIQAKAIGSIMNPEDFSLRVEWDIAMIEKLENKIKAILRAKMNLLGKIKEKLKNSMRHLVNLKNKLKDLGKKLGELICRIPGIRELCDKIRGDMKEVEREIEPTEREIEQLQEEIKRTKISEFMEVNWEKFKIKRGSFSANLSKFVGSSKSVHYTDIEFDTNIADIYKDVLLKNVEIENPFDENKEEEFVNNVLGYY